MTNDQTVCSPEPAVTEAEMAPHNGAIFVFGPFGKLFQVYAVAIQHQTTNHKQPKA